jgi:hypothetical protein
MYFHDAIFGFYFVEHNNFIHERDCYSITLIFIIKKVGYVCVKALKVSKKLSQINKEKILRM